VTAHPHGLSPAAIPSPAGLLRIRSEREEDAEFRFDLFRESRPDLALLPLDAAGRDGIMRMQFRAQTAGYRAQFPAAGASIVELQGRPIGRIVVDRSGGFLHLVEITLSSAIRGRGAGTALLRSLMDEARTGGHEMRLKVAANNPDAQRLYLRLGFAPVERGETHTELAWHSLE